MKIRSLARLDLDDPSQSYGLAHPVFTEFCRDLLATLLADPKIQDDNLLLRALMKQRPDLLPRPN